jgi:hypothetical protein
MPEGWASGSEAVWIRLLMFFLSGRAGAARYRSRDRNGFAPLRRPDQPMALLITLKAQSNTPDRLLITNNLE